MKALTPFFKDCPCTRECPRRDESCHGTCKDYAKWVKKHEAENEERRKAEQGAKDADDILIKSAMEFNEVVKRVKKYGRKGGKE